MKTIKPAATQLFCKQLAAETQTKSGLFIPGVAAEKPKVATVIAAGSSVKGFTKDDEIIYKAYSTTEVKLDNVEYFLVDQEDVLGTVIDGE